MNARRFAPRPYNSAIGGMSTERSRSILLRVWRISSVAWPLPVRPCVPCKSATTPAVVESLPNVLESILPALAAFSGIPSHYSTLFESCESVIAGNGARRSGDHAASRSEHGEASPRDERYKIGFVDCMAAPSVMPALGTRRASSLVSWPIIPASPPPSHTSIYSSSRRVESPALSPLGERENAATHSCGSTKLLRQTDASKFAVWTVRERHRRSECWETRIHPG